MADESVSEEPGNGFPAQTSSTTSESYYPGVREEGEIPIRFFDTTNGQLPSFFYAPRDDLDLDWSLEPFDYLFRTELEQFESVLHHLHDLNDAPALFVRDNDAGVNLLYSGSPHIYRYNDTYQSWGFNYRYLENGGGKISIGFKNTSPKRNEVAHGPWPKAFTPKDVSQSCDSAKKTFRRVVLQEGIDIEGFGSDSWKRLPFPIYRFDQGAGLFDGFYSHSVLRICWYKISANHSLGNPFKPWPSGHLYGSGDTKALSGQTLSVGSHRSQILVFTTNSRRKLIAIYPESRTSAVSPGRWICLIFTPSGHIAPMNIERILAEPLFELPLALCLFASFTLREVVSDWEDLLQYMESLVSVHTLIADPEGHDRLLFDDERFSRSRMYFWMLSSLATFINMMEDTKLNCERLQEYAQEQYPDTTNFSMMERNALEAIGPQVASLDRVTKRAKTLQQSVVALSDGLFSASAVLESRSANRLGENVKLLTYVSIFYLPLAFCTSLWSTTDTFSWAGLKITMVLTAIVTYLVTFNLNQLVRLSRSIYNVGKKKVVKSMTESENDDWKKRGARFGQVRPPRSKPQPSEWLLLWYLFEAVFAPIWSAVSKLCRALFSASNTASYVPQENLAPSRSGSGPQEVKEESTSESATAEALPAEDDAKPEKMTEDAKHSAIDHQTSDADPTPEFQATSGASEQDENVGSIHTSTASGNLAQTPVVGSMSQPLNTSLPIPGLLSRHSRKAPDLEAGAGATDECERD